MSVLILYVRNDTNGVCVNALSKTVNQYFFTILLQSSNYMILIFQSLSSVGLEKFLCICVVLYNTNSMIQQCNIHIIDCYVVVLNAQTKTFKKNYNLVIFTYNIIFLVIQL